MSDHFEEKDIRPRELMAEQRLAMLMDIGRLLSRRRDFIRVACPACDAKEGTRRFEKYGLDYYECHNCKTLYINPRPSPAVLEWFYQGSENYAYWNKYIFPASEDSRRKGIVVPRVERVLELCKKYGVTTGALMEVGAGFGTFCLEMLSRRQFQRIVAIEPTPDLAATCRHRGLETFEVTIERLRLAESDRFNIVASFEVIEHLFSPRDFLLRIVTFLKPGGLLVVTCPNGQGFEMQTLGVLSETMDHEHLNYFNPHSLSMLISSCGLEVLETFTPGHLDAELVRNKILSGEYDVSHQPFFKKLIVDDWERLGWAFQGFLADHGLSSHMWLVARKS